MTNKLFIGIVIILISGSCINHEINDFPSKFQGSDSVHLSFTDTLRIGTLYSSTSYFTFQFEPMGYEYEMAENLSGYLKVPFKIITAKTEDELVEMLKNESIDIVAYHLFQSLKLKSEFEFVFPQNNNQLVLVQNIGVRNVSNPVELNGKTVHVPKNSAFSKRLETLNFETGGNINIVVADDSLSTDDLIEMLANKKIEFTVTDSKSARLYKQQYKLMDMNVSLSFYRKTGWLISKKNNLLKKNISDWLEMPETKKTELLLYSKYWEKNPYFASRKLKIRKGALSPFDEYFKKYAAQINWEWQMLAAVAFNESNFDPDQISWAGASGIMQLMPRTAANFGLNRSTIFDPERNIEAGVQYIKSLNMVFRKVPDKEERLKFILASYNSGPAHVLDAMKLAQKYGKNPYLWFDNVDIFLLKKSDPEFYKDPVVQHGKFKGRETIAYVINTLETYQKFVSKH